MSSKGCDRTEKMAAVWYQQAENPSFPRDVSRLGYTGRAEKSIPS